MSRSSEARGATFEQFRPRLTAISCRIVGNQAEAEDIVQDCFFKWDAADQTALLTPAAWLTTVVQHHSIDRLRQRARDGLAAQGATDMLPEAAPALPDAPLMRRAELGEALARMLACLSPPERTALVLHEVFECAHADVAALLGTSTVNTRQHLARARKRLRAQQEGALPQDALCRELLRRFQCAINGLDAPAMVSLLAGEQPISVHQAQAARQACANQACYALAA
jgi:RNA polymerase sigma factor (sigma-70 family)